MEKPLPWGYRWRSSRTFIIFTVTVALFAETFLYGFLVPILSYMIEVRLRIDPSETQRYMTTLLSLHGFLGIVAAPIIAHFADQTPNRKIPLLVALAGCFVGTGLVASTYSVAALFVGRVMQAIAGCAAWVVGHAMLTDHIDADNLGKALGLAMTVVTAGIISGPTVAGAMLELFGYWSAWSVPLIVLAVDIVARLIMLEPGDRSVPKNDETTGLLQSTDSPDATPEAATNGDSGTSRRHFYQIMLSDPRVVAGLANTLLMSSIFSGFEATLPLHLRAVFHWGSLATGLMFFCLQIPSFFLSAATGWMRDRQGLRTPTALGWFVLAPLLWLLGVPGDDHFPWAGADTHGPALFTTTMFGFGLVSMLVRGAGSLQVTWVVKEKQRQNPQIFGPHGGSSRSFSMVEMAFGTGSMLGPLVAGSLSETVGYYATTSFFAFLCLVLAGVTYKYYDTKPARPVNSVPPASPEEA
ncbi:putative MFS transporter [Aspergillus saccharolyticus JOP 1030-1]|uniref:MFS general substrate transporter n=1 Tax=Aspergillus saccharolyticus JOP 1030-1 TaxID=1450539 RepID=A0A318ZHK9_9EURO|nr:MFS general substrate transporter [Aspergillus saccharolyticus JOP 1030-1]PYH46257.1 MFS general substrate transporter [Aspergillus saccharolyticus JOP 1030-1]